MIAIGSDHGGFDLKKVVINYLKKNNIDFVDVGCFNTDSVDYPDIACHVCKKIQNSECEKGILICGTGIGISIAANKHKGIRAALCGDTFSAKYTRLHNDSNVLCMGGRVIGSGLAEEIIDIFLTTEFEGGRHLNRIKKISKIENV